MLVLIYNGDYEDLGKDGCKGIRLDVIPRVGDIMIVMDDDGQHWKGLVRVVCWVCAQEVPFVTVNYAGEQVLE